MKLITTILALAALASVTSANVAPTNVIVSAAMRPNTTYMDVVYRVDDPDDATVAVRALAFVNGVRSFANVLRPVTFVEGTDANIGDAITPNVEHTLTWDVGADWNIDLGQVKFEVLSMDGRGLLPFDWITIPAAGDQPALTISKATPSDASVLNALLWLHASGDPSLSLSGGTLSVTSRGGIFSGVTLASGTTVATYARPFLFERMNLDVATSTEVSYAANSARANLSSTANWHAANRSFAGISVMNIWGNTSNSNISFPYGAAVTRIAAGGTAGTAGFSLALKADGSVAGWGNNGSGQVTIPAAATNMIAIAAGGNFSLALRTNGTVIGWGANGSGQTNIPAAATNVIAIAAGSSFGLALKANGTVIGWGFSGGTNIPATATNVIAIAAGNSHGLALRGDGVLVGWGSPGLTNMPAGLTNAGVTAIAAGNSFSLALKSNGTVVGWGSNTNGVTNIPSGLTNVTAIAAGANHALALKSDGTVVGWGGNTSGQSTIPAGLTNVSAIAAGGDHSMALKAKTQ